MGKVDDFVHLHNHSDMGSKLDGLGSVKDYVNRAAEMGQRSIALTDHGTMMGSYAFQREALKAGVNPIWGVETYMAPISYYPGPDRFNHTQVFYGKNGEKNSDAGDVSGNGSYLHLTLLAKDEVGVHNLIKINSESWITGMRTGKGKPRADQSLLEEYSSGLIFLSGCPSSEIQTRLRLGDIDGAENYLDWAIQVFGRENVFLEVMDHNMPQNVNIERDAKNGLLYLHDRFNVPFVATNDAHYVTKSQHLAHEHVLAIQTNSNMNVLPKSQGGDRFCLDGDGYYLRSSEEMRRAIPAEFVDACDNTLLIAEMCETSRLTPKSGKELWIDMSKYMPKEYGEDKSGYMLSKAKDSLREIRAKLGEEYTPEDDARLEEEMSVIGSKGYADYFAFSSDFSEHMNSNYGVLFNPGRGSVGGSLTAYALGITLLDPMKYGLLFERFLNPQRDSPPDIDYDISEQHEPILNEYVREKYGRDRVSCIATLGRIKAKAAMKDAARILGYPYNVGEKLSNAIDPSKTISENDGLDDVAEKIGAIEVVEAAKELEGIVRQPGVHACGLIASSVPISDMAPLMMGEKKNVDKTVKKVVTCQWEYPLLEELGFVKFDFLSLRNLDVINKTIESVKENHGITIDAREIVQGPMDDEKAYALINKGITAGMFQIDGEGITSLAKMIGVSSIHDIAAILALYRPGPMGMGSHIAYAMRKNGKEKIEYIHPEVEEALKTTLGKTYGLTVYQEQIMSMSRELAGYSLAEADILRRAVGKKKKEVLDEQEDIFKGRMKNNGYSQAACDAVWDVIVPFSEYGFNASHAYGYALITYMTAYLKAHYAPEFMASLISVYSDKRDKVKSALQQCEIMGIKILPPYVNNAMQGTSSDGVNIYLGFDTVKGCGTAAADAIIKIRPFSDLTDFSTKIGELEKAITSTAIRALVNAGGFDNINPNRAATTFVVDDIIERSKKIKKLNKTDEIPLFGGIDDLLPPIKIPDIPDFPKMERLNREKETLGLYISGHPLDNSREYLKTLGSINVKQLHLHEWETVTICGMVTEKMKRRSKKGNMFAKLTLEDVNGDKIETFGFGASADVADHVLEDNIVQLFGKVRPSSDGGENTINIEKVKLIPVDGDGNIIIPITMTEKTWKQFGANDEERTKGILDQTFGGGQQRIVFKICDFDKIRDLGLQIPAENRTSEKWGPIIEKCVRSIPAMANGSGANLIVSKLGRIAFETWEDRLAPSMSRWING